MSGDNEFAAAKRKEKARKVSEYIIAEATRNALELAIEQAVALDDEGWLQVLADAGHSTKKPPSEESKRLIIELVRAAIPKAPEPKQQQIENMPTTAAEYPD